MLTMNADRWIFLLALCFICVSSNDFNLSCELNSDVCETQTLSAPLGSSVLLPCNFAQMSLDWVSWAHAPEVDLVHLTSNGSIKFLDHRYGRVKAFPNQGSAGNYSICIDELQNADLGCYRCKQGHNCLQVELVAKTGAPSQEMFFICVGVAAFMLLSVGGVCCMKCMLCCNDETTQDNLQGASAEGASAPPTETGRGPVDQQLRGAGNDNPVYENDNDQDPSNHQDDLANYCNPTQEVLPDPDGTQPTQSTSGIYPNVNQFQRTESQRTKLRFHRELFRRLQQASLRRHYYENRAEISRQLAMSTQAENHLRGGEYRNPIYNRSADQLNL